MNLMQRSFMIENIAFEYLFMGLYKAIKIDCTNEILDRGHRCVIPMKLELGEFLFCYGLLSSWPSGNVLTSP